MSGGVFANILMSHLQAWIMDKLEDGKTKVVVVDSSLANQSLSLNSGEVLKVDYDD